MISNWIPSTRIRLHWMFLLLLFLAAITHTIAAPAAIRQQLLLSDAPWQFLGAGESVVLPEINSPEFNNASWATVQLPHVFQTRADYSGISQGWYRRDYMAPSEFARKRLYLVFEGAASIADVYVNGKHLGQHRGAYTRFLFDATGSLHPGTNSLAVRVDNSPRNTTDCLPSGTRLYKVWGGLYRKVWLLATDPLHIDPTDDASPGVYITPTHVSPSASDLSIRVLVRSTSGRQENARVRATLVSPSGARIKTLDKRVLLQADARETVELETQVSHPRLWAPGAPNLYHVRVELLRGSRVVDSVTQPTGFRSLTFQDGRVTLNGKPITLVGANLHQETESRASAMSDEDFRANFALMQDLGINWLRLPHYPHAQIEYDLCDQLGILCWAENGHSNSNDIAGPTGDQITTELVKQNYNHPSIAVWSMGNEASAGPAERFVPLAKALDSTRPVAVANMRCGNADFHTAHIYSGWYGGDMWSFPSKGYVTETGAGGVVTTHCDYAAAKYRVDQYEPEEYQQLVAEARFQKGVRENNGDLGMFTWWCLRDFSDNKYKKPVGWNTKGLLTYAGDKKDVYYLYRCFLRPTEPTVHITSKRYFLRSGAVDNGIKAYSSAPRLTLTLNGEKVSTLENGKYTQPNGHRIDNVFFWPAPLHTGKNTASVSDDSGHTDSAIIYFYGEGGLPELPVKEPLIRDLKTSNPINQAHYMDMPVQPQWPIYSDLDSTADNSLDRLPEPVQGATWIATRRVTKPGQETDLTFTLTRPAAVYVMCTKTPTPPSFLTGFSEVASPELVWRDNKLLLVPAQLFVHKAIAGETIHIPQPGTDMIVMLKE